MSGQFQCVSEGCAMKAVSLPAAAATALGGNCSVCSKPLQEVSSGLPPGIERAIGAYPYPIALPLQQLFTKVDVEARQKSLVDVLTNVFKYLAMVVQSEYLRSDLIDEDLTAIIRRDLGRPLVSAWIKFVEAAQPKLAAAGHDALVQELWPSYAAAETKRKPKDQVQVPGKGYHDEDGEFVETKAKLGLVRALISYRNKFAHGFNQPEEESREECDFYVSVLEQLLEELSWLGDYKLLKREGGAVWDMMGAEPRKVDAAWPTDGGDSGLLLQRSDGSRSLPLFPLFIVPSDYVAETKAGEDLLVYDQDTGKRIVYVSPRGHHREIVGTLRHWRALLEQKEVLLEELTASSLSPDEVGRRAQMVTRDTEESLLASRKVLKGVYVEREGVELHLRRYPASIFPLSLVTAQAGSGKTSLLHHLGCQWQADGVSVVLVRANAIEGADLMAWLRRELRLADDVDAAALAQQGASADRPLVLVIDGLNEHAERAELLASILAVAAATRGEGHLRIQVSWRSEQADWAEAADAQGMLFYPAPTQGGDKQQGGDSSSDRAPRLNLGPWSPAEVAELWTRMSKSDKQRFLPKFTHEQLREARRAAAQMLSNPLVLRTFLEVYAGQKMPSSPSRRALQQAWYERLGERTGDDNRLLLDLARMCMEQQAQALDLDALYDEARTASEVRRTDVAAPFTRLLRREGVLGLVRGEQTEVVFAMDRYLEQAAAHALVEDGAASTPVGLLATHDKLQDWPLIDEALRNALELRMAEEGRNFLWDLIDAGGEKASELAGEALARLVLDTRDPEGVAKELMSDVTEGDLHAAMAAAAELEEELAYALRCDFLQAVVAGVPDALAPTEAEMKLREALASALWEAGR